MNVESDESSIDEIKEKMREKLKKRAPSKHKDKLN